MKTIEDLKSLREKYQAESKQRLASGIQIIIGMGTCGIAAGGREVLAAIKDEIAKLNLQNIIIRQVGCIGMCEKEVLVDVVRPGEPRVTYGAVTPAVVAKIIGEHVVNGRIVGDLVVGKIVD